MWRLKTVVVNYPLLVCAVVCMLLNPAHGKERVDIRISGVNDELKQNIEFMLSLYQQKDDEALNKERVKRLYKKSFDEIKQALQPFGYFKPEISSELQQNNDAWNISYSIKLNDPMYITRLDIRLLGDAKDEAAFIKLVNNWSLKKGEVLDQRIYKDAKLKLQNLAATKGYFKAYFKEHKILVDLEKDAAEIILHFDSGQRYNFGEVILDAPLLSKKLINKYVGFKQGEPYTLEKLVSLQSALNDSEYFQSVEITPRTDSIKNDEVPIEVKLIPQEKRRYSLGLGYGTDTGYRARFGIDAPLINTKGHRFDTVLQLSELKNAFAFHYRIPVLNPRTDELAFTFEYDDEKTVTSLSEMYLLGVALIHGRGPWRESLSVTYQEERFEVADDSGKSALLMPGVSWSRIWGKERIYTRKGTSLNLDLKAASQYLFSDADFVQGKAYVKWIRGLSAKSRVIARGTLGAVFANEFETVPSSIRFFAGGDNSVRGYKYNSLGPENSEGEVIGGRGLMVASIEFEHNIWQTWDAAIFYDIGNAVDFFDEPLKRGVGIGVRWKSPVGPIRLDVGFALSEVDTPWRIHLNLGPDL